MTERKKAILTYRHPADPHAGGYEYPGEAGTTPHFIIPCRAVSDQEILDMIKDERDPVMKVGMLVAIRHVLNELGLTGEA